MNFDATAFAVFEQDTLATRMEAIQTRIQPVFRHYGAMIAQLLGEELGQENVPVHIAKHLRRTTNPPESTWVGIGGNQRGYKRFPHFQIGINPEYVFIMLALIDNPDCEKEIAQQWQQTVAQWQQLSNNYAVIVDHTQLAYQPVTTVDWKNIFERMERVKRAEFMVGRIAKRGAPVLSDERQLEEWLLETVKDLLPWYQEACALY
ncbi:DUF1054 family protein [Aerococcaceae bacterium zg-BR9]|uniref:DUF1054 family protein n=1 Tax=Aerococcaceae bacterium zg-1292 TaxID=2774330 RepID=UPI004062EFCB|nr:DUF1054 family protein [Aerococcaceae bacterium zg-BR9]